MEHKDKKKFAELFTGMADVYKSDISPFLLDTYFNAFKRFSIEQVTSAFNNHVQSSKFFPKPSEIIELIEGSKEDKALTAWTLFRDTIKHQGGDRSVIFSDPKITHIIESYGGWIKVCEMETTDLDFMRLGFLKAYINIRDDLPQKKLIGRFEWENSTRGYLEHIPKTLIIGEDRDVKQLTEN